MINLLAFFPSLWPFVTLEPERWIDDKQLDALLDEGLGEIPNTPPAQRN